MKILVTGSGGMVGNAIQKVFPEKDLIITDKKELDVRDYNSAMKFKDKQFDYILHLAAETDLEYCQKNPDAAYATNTIGCANMVLLAEYKATPIIYIGTAGIFDGKKKDAYVVDDYPNPLNIYGRSKWYGELFIRNYWRYYILRASWMMGGGPDIDKKFVNKIIKKINSGQTEIKVCDDVFGSPTYTMDLAQTIKWAILNKTPFGTYHSSGRGGVSRYHFAKEIVELLGLKGKIKIVAVKDRDVQGEFPCPRSKNETLENFCIPTMRDWRVSLKEYIDGYFKS